MGLLLAIIVANIAAVIVTRKHTHDTPSAFNGDAARRWYDRVQLDAYHDRYLDRQRQLRQKSLT